METTMTTTTFCRRSLATVAAVLIGFAAVPGWAEDKIAVIDTELLPGTWVMTGDYPLMCKSPVTLIRFYTDLWHMNIDQLYQNLTPEGCQRVDKGIEVQLVKQKVLEGGDTVVCARLPMDAECLWLLPRDLESKEAWNKQHAQEKTTEEARAKVCGKISSLLAHVPGVTLTGKSKTDDALHYDYLDGAIGNAPDGGSIYVDCYTATQPSAVMGLRANALSLRVLSLFVQLAHAVGVDDAKEVQKAAESCYASAVHHRGDKAGTFEGDHVDTDKMHVDCRASAAFISLGVAAFLPNPTN
jgi:hypothetical protein